MLKTPRCLSVVLESKGPLSVEDAVEYILQACEALAEAHAGNIIHRDLKPANLFLTRRPDGSRCIKVIDFAGMVFVASGLAAVWWLSAPDQAPSPPINASLTTASAKPPSAAPDEIPPPVVSVSEVAPKPTSTAVVTPSAPVPLPTATPPLIPSSPLKSVPTSSRSPGVSGARPGPLDDPN